jgi:hypothetical protein
MQFGPRKQGLSVLKQLAAYHHSRSWLPRPSNFPNFPNFTSNFLQLLEKKPLLYQPQIYQMSMEHKSDFFVLIQVAVRVTPRDFVFIGT